MARQLLDLALRRDGRELERVRTLLDPDDGDQLLAHLLVALKRNDVSLRDIATCALDVRKPGFRDPEFRFTALDDRGRR